MMRFFIAIVISISLSTAYAYDWTLVEETLNSYLMNGAFVGGILRVSNGTNTIYNMPFGHLSHSELPFSSPFFSNDTIFDMASITKTTATLSCIMHLFEAGKLEIDDLVTKFIPEYGNHGK
jgi:serine-type D-Ala-D-Ala carboxypeptidase